MILCFKSKDGRGGWKKNTTQCKNILEVNDKILKCFVSLFQFTMTVYNPIGRSVSHWVRLPVIGKTYVITDPNGKTVPYQVCLEESMFNTSYHPCITWPS